MATAFCERMLMIHCALNRLQVLNRQTNKFH